MSEIAGELRRLANDHWFLWNVPRKAIEDTLVEFRDGGIMQPLRNNGLVIKFEDGTPSNIIRFGPETAVRIALLAIADHLEES